MRKVKFTVLITLITVVALLAIACGGDGEEKEGGFIFESYGWGYAVTGYVGNEAVITIPDTFKSEPVIHIGEFAFFEATSITGVTIGTNIVSIGDGAFASTGLFSIIIPDNVVTIGFSAFRECANLESVTIGNGVNLINNLAFYANPEGEGGVNSVLSSVTFKKSNISTSNIGNYSFTGDLKTKYLAGGAGTYTTSDPGVTAVWTKN